MLCCLNTACRQYPATSLNLEPAFFSISVDCPGTFSTFSSPSLAFSSTRYSSLLSQLPTLETSWWCCYWTSSVVYVIIELLEVYLKIILCWRVGDDSVQGRGKDYQGEDCPCDTKRHSDMHTWWEVQLDVICRTWQDFLRAWSRQKVCSWRPGWRHRLC